MPDTLDDLLVRSEPPVSLRTPDAAAALASMAGESRRVVALERKRRLTRRAVGAVAVVALAGAGTAAAAGVLPGSSHTAAWSSLTDEAAESARILEWTSIHPVDSVCVERLTTWGLSDAQLAQIKAELSDPGALLAKDDGAVRREFLDKGWATGSVEDTDAIDAAYAEVASLDFAAGRGALSDDQLTADFMTNRYDELFANVYWRLILDGIGAGPHDDAGGSERLQDHLEPETACAVPSE